MYFLCDAMDMKQSVEGTVTEGTVLNKVHVTLKLYSVLHLCPHEDPSFPKVSYLHPPKQNIFQNFPF